MRPFGLSFSRFLNLLSMAAGGEYEVLGQFKRDYVSLPRSTLFVLCICTFLPTTSLRYNPIQQSYMWLVVYR